MPYMFELFSNVFHIDKEPRGFFFVFFWTTISLGIRVCNNETLGITAGLKITARVVIKLGMLTNGKLQNKTWDA